MAGRIITDFNAHFRKEMSGKSGDTIKIEGYEKEIKQWKELIRRQGALKAKITKNWRSNKTSIVDATNRKNEITQIQNQAKNNIEHLKNRIKLINNDKDAYIEIIGYFGNYYVKKSQLFNVKNPAAFLLKKELARANKYKNSAFFDLSGEGRKRGINIQAERLEKNIALLGEGEDEDYEEDSDGSKYPVFYVALPTSISFL